MYRQSQRSIHGPRRPKALDQTRRRSYRQWEADFWVFDWDRDGRWDYSLISSKHDGKVDLIGYHPDGKVVPSRYEAYKGQPTPWAN